MADDNKKLIPVFIVYLNGTRFSAQQEADVKEIVIIDQVDAPSQFVITMSDMGRKWTDNNDFSIGNEIKIMLGYKDDVEDVINGELTGILPSFKKNSDAIVKIKGNNQLQRLTRGKKTRAFAEMKDIDIIKQIATDSGLKDDIEDIGIEHKFTVQRNQTDYDYLMDMAKMYNCKVWAREGTLFFKPMEDNSDEEVIIEWGKTLLEFHPRLDCKDLITEVETRGWDPEKGVAIVGGSLVDEIKLKVGGDQFGGALVKENFGDYKMIYIDDNIIDQNGADRAALDIISVNSMSYINGTGKCQGNYKIKPGMMIELKELSGRFSGKYYVNTVQHRFAANQGFSTSFKVIRNTT